MTAADGALTGSLLRQIRALREKYAVDEAAGVSDETLATAAAAALCSGQPAPSRPSPGPL
ncbi:MULTISPECIES: hypothetical protein [unclassified Streptomyces]|uniref:hypothetical protein n=1 Tax=unclassified Streptomyces TaxID=2593676 RepID=UPI00248286BC|nr:hypothetical protein [Streptomyces sp. ATE26]MDI1456480.1 hypothetical protein [Streptomyces sp. ATE26]